MSIYAPEQLFLGRHDAISFQIAYNYYIFGHGRMQKLKAAGPLESLLCSTDLVNGGGALLHLVKNFKPLSIFSLNFWSFGPLARIDAANV